MLRKKGREASFLFFLLGWSLLQAPSGGWLGVTVQDLTPQMAARLGIQDQQGALVTSVQFGSPAKKGGLLQGDVILSLNGRKIPNTAALRKEISSITPETLIRLRILRERREQTIEIRVGAPPREAT